MWAKAAFAVLPLLFFPIIGTLAQSEAPHGGGTVCPAGMSIPALKAAGCRWIGSETGYDICANPGTENLPQCYAVYHVTTGQPDTILSTARTALRYANE